MKRIVKGGFLLLGLGLLFVSHNAEARSSYWRKLHDPRVNTWLEKRYDRNGDGWISGRERRWAWQARAEKARYHRCDKNRDGRISRWESRCL